MNIYEILGLEPPEVLVSELIDAERRKALNHPYLSPSDRPLSWDKKGKLVPLDFAILAVHLMAAQIAFKGFAGLLASLARIAENKARSVIIDKGLKNTPDSLEDFSRRLGFLLYLLQLVGSGIERATIEVQKEGKIRLASIKCREDLYNLRLFQRFGSKRETKYVHTRHKTPKQRNPNKQWHSPKSNRPRMSRTF